MIQLPNVVQIDPDKLAAARLAIAHDRPLDDVEVVALAALTGSRAELHRAAADRLEMEMLRRGLLVRAEGRDWVGAVLADCQVAS
jgi:hypothetical protein